MTPFLSARKIVKKFPGVLAHDEVDFDVERGEIHALLGENGAGKSTLMQILCGLYGRDGGEVLVDGAPVEINSTRDAIAAGIGMIHQEFMLVRRFTVAENIVLGLEGRGRAGRLDLREPSRRIWELSDCYALKVDPHRVIEDLSVGVQQRVEILKLLYRHLCVTLPDT
jgi:general nucleoside transport system ATP-binding protein